MAVPSTWLIAGSVNVDLIGRVPRFGGRDEAVMLSQFTVAPGGHAGNCATALARLGARVRLVACVGSDALGTLVLGALRAAQVDVNFIEQHSEAATGIAFVPVLPDGDRTLYIARGANEHLSGRMLDRAAGDCSMMVAFDPPFTLFPRLAEVARQRVSIFAPGSLVSSGSVETLAPLLQSARFLVVNGPESRMMTALEDPRAAAQRLSTRWGIHAVVTIGKRGCWIADPAGEATHCPSFAIDVADATGAGDAFVAGFCSALARGEPPLAAVRSGCAVAALATRALGAQASLPAQTEVAMLLSSSAPSLGPRVPAGPPPVPDGKPERAAPQLDRGADGWRGIVGEGFSPDAAAVLAAAIGEELKVRFSTGSVLVAHDARFQSAETAQRVAVTLAGAGLRAVCTNGAVPTPATTLAVRQRGYLAAVIITASHNPFYWNGVKLKVRPGMPPGRELEAAIERRHRELKLSPMCSAGTGGTVGDPVDSEELAAALLDAALARVDTNAIRSAGLRVGVDGLHGVAGPLLKRALEAAGCSVELLGGDADPLFSGLVPDPTRAASRTRLAEYVRSRGADLGLLLDGDGDRLGVVDGRGRIVWPHDVMALLLKQWHRRDGGPGVVATTVATGSIVRRLARSLGREVVETAVGFKHIAPMLQSGRAVLGGGAVGDVGFRGHGCDRDPFLAALVLLEIVARGRGGFDKVVGALHADHGNSAYGELTLPVSGVPATKLEHLGFSALREVNLASSVTEVQRIDGVKLRLGETAWLLLRPASTEPGIRVHAELATPEELASLIEALQRILA